MSVYPTPAGEVRITIAEAVVPNWRFGDHHISVEYVERDGCSPEYVYRDGYSDPLVCSRDYALGLFGERMAKAA